MEKPVLIERDCNTAIIKLNRPERRNAVNQDMLINLYGIIEEIDKDDDVIVAIITGNGKSFSSGVDLDIATKENLMDPCENGKDLPDVFGACRKPIIGAINGHAINAGFEMALNCDFLIASHSASFLDTHAKMGIQPGWGMSQLLQDVVGQRMAKQISFACQPITAEEAQRIGLVNEVVEDNKLMPRVLEIAKNITQVNNSALRIIKELIEFQNGASLNDSYSHERKEFKDFLTGQKKGSFLSP